MEVTKHKVVTIDYKLSDPKGTVLDSSEQVGPLSYIHGVGGLIPGLENALEGKTEGDSFQTTVPPEEGYGQRDERLVQRAPKQDLAELDEVAVGMQLRVVEPDGSRVVTVVDVDDEAVTLDGNHILAGIPLTFDVAVVGIREATDEELQHGHVHGANGHETD
ncbi:MAG: peptidylprolyl isomerase [Pirellulales bacterium]